MDYVELNIPCRSAEESEILVAELSDYPFESFADEEHMLKAYIPQECLIDCKEAVDALLARHSIEGARYISIESQNWNALWESNFTPIDVYGKVYIRAPFHAARPDYPVEVVIMPKMSFGTGHHATTRLMCREIVAHDFSGCRCLDMGSGTGVLAIVAAKRGAEAVDAVDIDEWAYENCRENIAADLAKIKETGFTDVIVDVRPSLGDVLFNSTVADPLTRVDAWADAGYVWLERTADFDYLQAFIDEGHKLGLRVNASINTFAGGYLCPYGLGSDGMLFRDADKKDWATVINAADGLVNTMDLLDDTSDYGAKFMNPANDDVQAFVLQLLRDLAKYNLDGIVLDRCRYDDYGLMSDFSDVSRAKFEEYIGETVPNFPADIMAPGTEELPAEADQPAYFKKWLEFRAKVIHDFMVDARDAIKSVNDTIRFGAYVGAWYSTYYTSGVNWASPKYDTAAHYPEWATEDYHTYGYADHTDFMFLGAYASTSDYARFLRARARAAARRCAVCRRSRCGQQHRLDRRWASRIDTRCHRCLHYGQ